MRATDWLLLLLLSVLWGATFFFVAVALPEIPPFTLVLARVAHGRARCCLPVLPAGLTGCRARSRLGAAYAVLALLNNVRALHADLSTGRCASPAGWRRC